MTEERKRLRISDADREAALARLNQALEEGRLDLPEFDSRSRAAYAAKTNAELDLVFEDLPYSHTAGQEVGVRESERELDTGDGAPGGRKGLPPAFHGLIWVTLPTIAVWAMSSISAGELQNFWPIWPIGIMIAVCAAQWLTGDEGGEDKDDDD